jgi:hypothetical protein
MQSKLILATIALLALQIAAAQIADGTTVSDNHLFRSYEQDEKRDGTTVSDNHFFRSYEEDEKRDGATVSDNHLFRSYDQDE